VLVVTITKAEKILRVSRVTRYRWLRDGFITGEQLTPGAPWQIRIDQALRNKIRPEAPDGWLPLDAAAQALGVAGQTVLHKVQRGELQAVHVNRGRRKGLRIQVQPGQVGLFDTPDKEEGAVLTMTGRSEEDHVVPGGGEVQGAQVRDGVAFEAAGVVEVELLQRLAGREPRGADAALAAVGLAGGDLALQAGGQELLMAPGLGPCPLGQPRHRLAQRRRLQRPGQERQLGTDVPGRRPAGHHATPPPVPRAVS
jgi:hypothetical protein